MELSQNKSLMIDDIASILLIIRMFPNLLLLG